MTHRILQNCWTGPDAAKEFLHPRNETPLVELPPALNPFSADDVRIFAKIYHNPHIKLLPAFYMLEDAKKSGKLDGVHTLVELSSGNTAHSLELFRRDYGIGKFVAVIARDLAPGKRQLLSLSGVEIVEHSGQGHKMAHELGQQKGWLNLNQYANPANPLAHEEVTGPVILEQTKGDITLFCAGGGTFGTLVGVSRFLKGNLDNITSIGVLLEENSAIPGVRRESQLEHIRFDWRKWSDHIEKVATEPSFDTSRKMILRGIPAGPSSGFALRGLLNFLGREKKAGRLDNYRKVNGDNDGNVIAVFVCPDSHDKYIEKYSTILDAEKHSRDNDTITE